MNIEDLGMTVEERVDFFQSRFMFKVMGRALLGVLVYSVMHGWLGIQGFGEFLFTFLFCITYMLTLKNIHGKTDIHGDYKTFLYKDNVYWIGDYGDEDGEINREDSEINREDGEINREGSVIKQLHALIREKMVDVEYVFLLIGMFFAIMMKDVQFETVSDYLSYAVIILILTTPFIIVYSIKYNKLINLFEGTIIASIFGVIYDDMVQKGQVDVDSQGYVEWVTTTDEGREELYSEEKQQKYKKIDKYIKEEVEKHVRVTPTTYINLNFIDDETKKELEDNINKELEEKGTGYNITLLGFEDEQETEEQQEEQQEEYDLTDLYDKEEDRTEDDINTDGDE